jgi:7tm Odorant receptor
MIRTLDGILKVSKDKRIKNRKFIYESINGTVKTFTTFITLAIVVVGFIAIMITEFDVLPYPVWYPFDAENGIGFSVTAVHQLLTTCYACTFEIVFDFLPIILMSFLVGLFNELAKKIDAIVYTEEYGLEKLIECIKLQKSYKEFADEIKQTFGFVLFVQGLFSTLSICSSFFTILECNDVTKMVHAGFMCIPLMLEVFLFCYYGQKLMDSSQNLIIAVCRTNWYDMDDDGVQTATMFVEFLNQPITISFNGYFHATHKTFGNIIFSAASFVGVLKNGQRILQSFAR